MTLRPFPPLLCLLLAMTPSVRAELQYALYDLTNPSAELEIVTPTEEELKGTAYRTADKLLVVRDTTLGSAYSMSVYELTKGQAHTLGWTGEPLESEVSVAYGQNGTQFNLPSAPWKGHLSLKIPTQAEWLAYAGTPERPCNLSDGLENTWDSPFTPAYWLTSSQQGHVSAHGLLDAFGNVAEYVSEGSFCGGYARTDSGDFSIYTKNPGKMLKASEITNPVGTNSSVLGVRLIYVPPADLTWSAQVTRDGTVVDSKQAKEDEVVALAWPEAEAGKRRITRTVTPSTLVFEDSALLNSSTFKMPTQDVTFAFEQRAVATIITNVAGEGGTVAFKRKAPPESFDTLPEDEAYAGETLILSATLNPSWRVSAWQDASGKTIAAAGSNTTWEYALPETLSPGSSLTFTAILERPTYEVALTLDNVPVAGWPKSFAEGEAVSIDPPETQPNTRLYRVAADGLSGVSISLTAPTTFAMPARAVTIAYTSRGTAKLHVVGGTASSPEPFIGETVTLSATPSAYQVFTAWSGAATSTDATFNYLVPTGVSPGDELTFTAIYDTLPRILLFGGTATVEDGTGRALGDGYYTEDAVLSLVADTPPEGYRFEKWIAPDGSALSSTSVTAASTLRNQTVTYHAAYVLDLDAAVPNPSTTHIGVNEDGKGTQAATTLGWEAGAVSEQTLQGNRFKYYASSEPTSDYARLDLHAKATDYPSLVNPALEINKTDNLILRRIQPKANTHYTSGDTYYVGIFETTVGHFKALDVPMNYEAAATKGDTYPYPVKTDIESPDTFIKTLNEAFAIDATRPSKVQIENITKAGTAADTTYNGAGWQNDRTITDNMIVYEGNGSYFESYQPVGSKSSDVYGFYDLWGNALEWLSDNYGWGGSAGLGANALIEYASQYSLNPLVPGNETRGAIRPAVVVPRKLEVTIKDNLSDATIGPFAVLPGQPIYLASQVRAGYTFTGWTADKTSGEPIAQADGTWLTNVEEPLTLVANYAEKQPLRVAYSGCIGPSEVLPGQTITLYTDRTDGKAIQSVAVTPEGFATADLDAGTLTFSTTASGFGTITVQYEVAKPGYRLRLR